MGKLKVCTLFSGYDSQCIAIDQLGIDYELVAWAEIDKYAIKAHNALYPQWADRNLGDVSKINWNNTEIGVDLLTYSFPCVPKGTKVQTAQGYKNIEDIQVFDRVLTHTNTYQNVIRTMSRLSDHIYHLKAQGVRLDVTENHPIYTYKKGKFQWVKVKDLNIGDGLCINMPKTHDNDKISDDDLWLLGRYVADGWINPRHYNSVTFAIAFKKEQEFKKHIGQYNFKSYKKSCMEYRVANPYLQYLCKEFGEGAKNKIIPQWVLELPHERLTCFVQGYLSGDGHYRERGNNKQWMFSTVSYNLYLGMQICLAKLYGKPCSVSVRVDNRKETFNDSYNGQVSLTGQTNAVIVDDKFIIPIKEIIKEQVPTQVYNIEVEKDNSYTTNNIIVHNCTNISTAGTQAGAVEGSGTASSLLWECRRVIDIKRPKFLLMENVKNLLGKRHRPVFDKWCKTLEDFGYKNFYQVMNAEDYGVPQHRERVIMVSILCTEEDPNPEFEFPEPTELQCEGVDYLEETNDETYYLNQEKVDEVWQELIV